MHFRATALPGVAVIEARPPTDERGYFARLFCREEFARFGLAFEPVQANLSGSRLKGTLRGLHYQAAPFEEDKLVMVRQGAVFDVIVDLRPSSPAFGRHHAEELSAANRRAVFVPRGCAHGYQTLTDEAEVLYLVSAAYRPEAERGLRWDDPALGFPWPQVPPIIISAKDSAWPLISTFQGKV
jgi:dTDP-4-dehydrorhamnose 3,5-epimerase